MNSGNLRYILPLLILVVIFGRAEAQLVINSGVTPDQMVQSLVGSGVTYSNVTYNGGPVSRGTFSGPSNIGIAAGVVLCTGIASTIPGAPGGSVGASGTTAVQDDPDMNIICTNNTNNGSILEFDFVPQGSQLKFRYVFASEEYPDYAPPCYSQFNDGFGFFISGPGLTGPYMGGTAPNIALIPGTSIPVSINTVNDSLPQYFVQNYTGNGNCNKLLKPGKITDPNFKFDGYTLALEATVTVQPCQTYHIKLGVANSGDVSEQSGVFLEESSFSSPSISWNTIYSNPLVTNTMVEGCNSVTVIFGIDSVTNVPVSIPLTITGTATNGTDYNPIPNPLVVLPGDSTVSITINPVADGLPEGQETLILTYNPTGCSAQDQSVTLNINDYQPLSITPISDQSTSCGQLVTLTALPQGGIVPFSYSWTPGGQTTSSISVSPLTTTLYTVSVNDGCTSNASQTANVVVIAVDVDAGPNATTCSSVPVTFTGNAANQLPGSQVWTQFGTGTLSGANTFSPTYTPGPGESGTIKIKLTVAGQGACAGQFYSDSLYLQIDPLPQPNAGIDASACSAINYTFSGSAVNGDPATIQWTHTGSGTLAGSTTFTPVYTPAVGQLGIVTFTLAIKGTGTCALQTITDQVQLNFEPPPTVLAGLATAFCASSTFTLANSQSQNCQSVSWTTPGDGSFSNPNILHPVYTPGPGDIAAGTILLTIQGAGAASCASLQSTDAILLTINPLPTADAGTPKSTCQGVNFTISEATASNSSTVSWTENGPGSLVNPNTLTPTYVPTPGETGMVTLTLTAHGANTCAGEIATSSMTLTVNPLPDVNAGADATICAANTYSLSGTQLNCNPWLWTTSGDGAFSNPNLLNPVYTPGLADIAAGSVVLTLTGQGTGACLGLTDVDQMTLFIDHMPTVNAGIDDAFCVLNPINVTGASATQYTAVQWTGGDGSFDNSTLMAPTYMPGNLDFNNGTVTLTITAQGNLSCSSQFVSDSRVFSVSPYPLVNAGPDDYICSNITQFTLAGTGNNYNLGNIQWTVSGGDGTLSNPNILNPVYTAGPIDLSTTDRTITFTLTIQGIGNCSGVFVNDQMILKIDPTPVSNAGPDDEICGQRPYQLNPTAQFQTTINWTTSGTGTFSNPGILNPTYTPGAADVGTIVVLTLDLSGCKSLTGDDFMWLTVHPDPSVTMSGSSGICEGTSTAVSIAFTGTPPWSVTYTDGITPVTVNNINTTPYTFNVSPAISTTWSINSANDAFCNVPSDSIHGLAAITVNALPDLFVVTGSNQGYYCEGDTGVMIGLNNSQTGMVYTLLRNGLSAGVTLPGTGFPLVFGLFTTPGQYSVQGQNPVGNCFAMMRDTINVIMNPTPVTDFTTNNACASDTTYFTLSGNFLPRTSTWHWTFGDGTFATYNAPFSPSHVYPTYGTYTVTLSVVDTNGCQYTVTHPVEVLPHPVAFFSFGTPNCLDGTTEFTDLSNNPSGQGYLQQWIWTFGDGSPDVTINFPDSPNVSHKYMAQGSYTVTLTVLNSKGCMSEHQLVVTVFNRPMPDFTFLSSCQEQPVYFTDISNENLGGQITGWLWNFDDAGSGALNNSILQNPVHIFSTAGDFQVTLITTNLNGCSDTAQKAVTVKAKPLANFFSSPGCLNSATLFLADSIFINPATTATYVWQFGDGGTAFSRNTTHIYLAPGTYNVTLTVTDTAGCAGDTTLPITVNPPPVAHFTANTDNCQSQAVTFADQSTSPTGFINKWIWNYGDGNADTITFPTPPNVNHTYAGAGTFSVTLTVINNEGCLHSESRLVNILGAPTSAFMFSGQCDGTPVTFTDLSTITGTQTISSWLWNFGDPTSGIQNTSILQNPTHAFATAGIYNVTLITFTGNGCSDTITNPVTIKSKPVVDFNTQSACANNAASFTPTGMAVGTISSWSWTFGDGGNSTVQAPFHTYTSAGTYTVTLTVTDTAGCSNTRSKPIVIAPIPDANFGYTTPTCQGDAVNFTDMSSTLSGYIARYHWDFGDGNTQTILFPASPDVSHQYANAGTFNVTLTVKTNDSCTNQLTRVVTVLPKPTAEFMHGAACKGNAVTFNDLSTSTSTGGISGWEWNFGDPASGTGNNSGLQNPTHIYNTTGNFTITLIVSIAGGCSDTASHQITVNPPPTVDFTPVAGCNGDTTQFTSSTLVNMATTQGWYWQFGDGGTSSIADPVHIYATAGMYTVTLTITDTAGCTNTKIKPVTVIAGPTAAFSSSTPGCSGLPITFTDLSNANGGSLSTWFWTFGDGTDTTYAASIPNFAHTYTQAGTFVVTLHVFTALGCENIIQHTVTISPSPIAGFGYANTCQGQSTQFTDMTSLNGGSSITMRAWDFGDPGSGMLNTSTLVNPIHNYALPNVYTVTLVTLNGGGCSDTLQQNVTITPKPNVDFYNDSLVCLGNTTTLYTDTIVTNTGTIQYYEWDFGDGSPHAFTRNATHTYTVAGTFNVTLTVQDTSGCENVKTHPLTIHSAPTSMFNYTGICENAPTQFTDLSLPPTGDTIVSWYWEFISGATTDTSTLQNPQYTFALPGTYTVKLSTFTENGCSNTKPQSVQIWNKPTAYFKYSASPCANGLVTFQDSSWSYQGTVNSWQWEFEPYQYGSGTNPSHQYYAVDSCYSVNLMIEDLRGCMDTTSQQVCVPPALTVDFNTDLICFGNPVNFNPQLLTPAAPADSLVGFSWNFGDPTTGTNNVSTQKSPAHTFSNVGFYTVNFTTTDKYGCSASSIKTVQVNALPVASFSYTTGQCDSTLVFSSTSVDTSSIISTYIWQYGDGTSDTLTTTGSTHKYSTPGEYLATLTVINANGCTDTFTDTVTRSACIVAATISTQSLFCQNYELVFADMSTCDGTITQWNWNFGDGTLAVNYATFKPSVSHTYTSPGPYTISLKVSTLVGTSTISDSTTLDILVKPTPLAGFTVDPVCLGVKAEFSDTTQANGATTLSFHWEFGDAGSADTSNQRNPKYLYSVPGTYKPQMVVQNQFGCADTATADLTVNGLPDAAFANSLACSHQKTYFFDGSQPYIAPLAEWGWRVRDSIGYIGSMQGATPSFTFDSTGRYQVMLTVADSNGCADTIIQQVSVKASPLSAFSYTENVDDIQGQIQFTNGSIGAEHYYWSFGDGQTSYSESPIITYADDGTYQVMLVSVSDLGCQDTALITYEMMFKGLYVPNAFAPGGSIQPTRIWKPVGVNLASYNVQVFNSHGMLLWKSTELDEHGTPTESWDGTYNEKPCQQDVYVWMITAIFRDGSVWYNQDVGEHKGLSEPVYGTVTLIR